MRKLLFALLVFAPLDVYAQNACATLPTGNIANPTAAYAVISDYSTIGPDGTPIVADFSLQVMNGATLVSSQTIAKTALLLQAGTPANCYRFTFPVISNTQPNTVYTVSLRANGSGGMSAFTASSNGFFLRGAPAAPGSFRLALLQWLEKLSASVRSFLK
jgi:hypothetical protein